MKGFYSSLPNLSCSLSLPNLLQTCPCPSSQKLNFFHKALLLFHTQCVLLPSYKIVAAPEYTWGTQAFFCKIYNTTSSLQSLQQRRTHAGCQSISQWKIVRVHTKQGITRFSPRPNGFLNPPSTGGNSQSKAK